MKITKSGVVPQYGDKSWVLLIEVDGEYKICCETDTATNMITEIQQLLKRYKGDKKPVGKAIEEKDNLRDIGYALLVIIFVAGIFSLMKWISFVHFNRSF